MPEENIASNHLYTSLREIGLSNRAAELYQLALEGELPVTEMAKTLGVSRPSVYALIDELERNGLIKTEPEIDKRKRHFIVEPPSAVLEKLRSKREKVEQLDASFVSEMPDLLALYHQRQSPTKVRVFQGRAEYLKIFEQILEEAKDEILYFGSFDHFVQFLSWEHELAWIKKRMKKNLKLKALVLSGEDTDTLKEMDKDQMRETKVLPTDMKRFSTSYLLYANKCIIWQPKTPLALLVEDQYIKQMMESIYEQLWRSV